MHFVAQQGATLHHCCKADQWHESSACCHILRVDGYDTTPFLSQHHSYSSVQTHRIYDDVAAKQHKFSTQHVADSTIVPVLLAVQQITHKYRHES